MRCVVFLLAWPQTRSRVHEQFMWYTIMNEFKCKASSTWCKEKEQDGFLYTDKMVMKGKKSQSDYIIGPFDRGVIVDASATTIRRGLRGTTF